MKLIVGLGNVGTEYAGTRHNFGFAAIDYLVEKLDIKWKNKSKFSAEIAKTKINNEKVLFIKPTTFYNLSCQSVRAIRDFYKLKNSDVLVIHDEIALPIGTLRARIGGSDAGNNGIKSLNRNLGEDFARIRIGSKNDNLPNDNHSDFVLSKPTASEKAKFHELLPRIEQIVMNFTLGDFEIISLNI